MFKGLGIPVLITLLLIGSILVAYYVIPALENAGPGILLTLNLYDINTKENKIVDVTSTIFDNPHVFMYLEVEAITPPTLEWEEDIITLIRVTTKPKRTIFIQSNELLKISEGWVSIYELRNGNSEETYSGLIIKISIYNSTSGDSLFEVLDSISYKPIEITRGKVIKVVASLVREYEKFIELDVEHYFVHEYEISQARIEEIEEEQGKPIEGYRRVRRLVAQIKPEDILSSLPADYFNYTGGRYYLKTPVLIAENLFYASGTVGVDVSMGRAGIYPTFTSGDVISKIKNGVLPSVTLWRGSGFSWGGSTYYFGYVDLVGPLESIWVWIWARPIYSMYKVYNCQQHVCYWVRDEVENVITDVLTYGSTIRGGKHYGLPHSNLTQAFFSGTEWKRLQIPGTYLDDGKLDPEEYIRLEQIFQYFDTCGNDFELGIPAGALAALGICIALGVPTGGTACGVAIAFASTFQLSLSIEGSSIRVGGGLFNHGDHPYVPGDGNYPEYVQVTISKYQYRMGSCYYNVPAGIYFRFN